MKLSKYVDHTLLKPEASTSQIKELCNQAKKYDFASVCVNPTHITLCKKELEGHDKSVLSFLHPVA